MKFSTQKATYSTSLLRNASAKDAAKFLSNLLDMVDASKNGEVTIKKLIGGYEFIRSDDPKLPEFVEGSVEKAVSSYRTQDLMPRTLESDLREDR